MAAFCIWCIIEQRLAGKQIRQSKDKNIRAENGMTGQKSKRQMISATEQERRKSASEYEKQKTEEVQLQKRVQWQKKIQFQRGRNKKKRQR